MADYGSKNSTQRGKWYDQVVSPLKTAAKTHGSYPWRNLPGRANWMGLTTHQIASTKNYPKVMRDMAKSVAGDLGIAWTGGKLALLTGASEYAQELKAEAAFMSGETIDDGFEEPAATDSAVLDLFVGPPDTTADTGLSPIEEFPDAEWVDEEAADVESIPDASTMDTDVIDAMSAARSSGAMGDGDVAYLVELWNAGGEDDVRSALVEMGVLKKKMSTPMVVGLVVGGVLVLAAIVAAIARRKGPSPGTTVPALAPVAGAADHEGYGAYGY